MQSGPAALFTSHSNFIIDYFTKCRKTISNSTVSRTRSAQERQVTDSQGCTKGREKSRFGASTGRGERGRDERERERARSALSLPPLVALFALHALSTPPSVAFSDVLIVWARIGEVSGTTALPTATGNARDRRSSAESCVGGDADKSASLFSQCKGHERAMKLVVERCRITEKRIEREREASKAKVTKVQTRKERDAK